MLLSVDLVRYLSVCRHGVEIHVVGLMVHAATATISENRNKEKNKIKFKSTDLHTISDANCLLTLCNATILDIDSNFVAPQQQNFPPCQTVGLSVLHSIARSPQTLTDSPLRNKALFFRYMRALNIKRVLLICTKNFNKL